MNAVSLAALLASIQGGSYVLLALPLFLRGKRLLAFISLISALWAVSQAAYWLNWLPGLQSDFSARLPLYGLLALAALLLVYALGSLGKRRGAALWLTLGAAWLGLALLADANPLGWPDILLSGGGQELPRRNFVLAALGLGWAFFSAAGAFAALRAYRQERQPLQRNRIKYLAAVITLCAAGDALVLANLWLPGGALRLVGMSVAAFAALVPRLPSLRRAVLRSLSYLITTGFAAACYLGVILVAQRLGDFGLSLPSPAAALILAAVLGVLIHPLLNLAQKWLDGLIAGVSHDPRRILREYSQSISNVLDFNLLGELVTGLVGEALGAQRGLLYLVEREKDTDGNNGYRLRSAEDQNLDVLLSAESALAEHLRQQRAPLAQEDILRFNGLPEEERAWLDEVGIELLMPILTKEEWVGLLALGPKHSGEPYWDDDQLLLSTLADQTAVALENARLVESLMRLNAEFRRAISALNQANRNLERLERTKSDFISIASHELRTPITVLSGYSQMLLDDPQWSKNPHYAATLNGIYSGAQRLHEVVDSMLDMAKIDSRDLQLDHQPVAAAAILQGVQNELKAALSERSQSFEMQEMEKLPPIEADQDTLRKVFYHLVSNAIKYTPDGGKISVRGRSAPPSAEGLSTEGVEIVVSDTGIGVDSRLQELIFTKFYQTGELALHSSGKTKFKGGGPGLGLAIARGIVEAHGGKIWVESPGRDETRCPGSRFHVLLPLRRKGEEKTRPLSY
ncbi:MAG: HAMP domain-containing histidine kinase [Chloroflexi bacterium]|nr:HAMP domain-containing histidine kinase [Chloroflexota bacterium]